MTAKERRPSNRPALLLDRNRALGGVEEPLLAGDIAATNPDDPIRRWGQLDHALGSLVPSLTEHTRPPQVTDDDPNGGGQWDGHQYSQQACQ